MNLHVLLMKRWHGCLSPVDLIGFAEFVHLHFKSVIAGDTFCFCPIYCDINFNGSIEYRRLLKWSAGKNMRNEISADIGIGTNKSKHQGCSHCIGLSEYHARWGAACRSMHHAATMHNDIGHL